MADLDIDYSLFPSTVREWVYALTADDCNTINCVHPGLRQLLDGKLTDAGWLAEPIPGIATPLQFVRWHVALDTSVDIPWAGTGWLPDEIRERWEADDAANLPAPPDEVSDLYFIGADDGPIKIGVSQNIPARLRGLQTSYPHRLHVLASIIGGALQEGEYHARFADARLSGEWFQRTPEILAEIERLSNDR